MVLIEKVPVRFYSGFAEEPAFLTTDPNCEVGAIHPKALPVILTESTEVDA